MTAKVLLHERMTEVEVCALPADHPQHRHFAIYVRHREGDWWAVMADDRHTLNATTGEFDYGSCPAGTDWDEWRDAHWFTYDRAIAIARDQAPKMTCNGFTVDDVRAWAAKADLEAT